MKALLRASGLLTCFAVPSFCPTFDACFVDIHPVILYRIAHSIARNEGWGDPSTLVRKQHNPLALSYARQRDARKGWGGYAVFKDDAAGWRAGYRDLELKIRQGITLRKLMRVWATGKGYLETLAADTGLQPDAVVP